MKKRLFAIALSLLVFGSACSVKLNKMTDKQKSELLATERGRLPDLDNPVEKTRSYITISEILLDFAAGAATDGDVGAVKSLLDQYTAAIRSARDTMLESDLDAERRPAGYRDLEISLRGQIRRLDDMQRQLSTDDRRPVTDALDIAAAIREQMLRRLFPQSSASRSGLDLS